MTFDAIVRAKIATTESKVAKGILKVVLGEYQQKNASGKATVNDGYSIIEKIVAGNKETLGYMKADDARRAGLEEETATVSALLPPYLSVDDTLKTIKGNEKLLAEVTTIGVANIGRATGAVVKFCKAEKLDVKGDTVKDALTKLFNGE